MRELAGRVAVITGAGSGFGRALAVRLATENVVPVLLDRDAEGLAGTAALLTGDTALYLLDVRDGAALQDAADKVQARFGRIDIMINNAGMISRAESFLEMDEQHAREVFDVNYWGVSHGCRAFVPYLSLRPEAALVNVASSLGVCGAPLHSAYCASKAAVISYSEVLRQELRDSAVAVTLALPGAAKTNLGRNIQIEDTARKEKAVQNFERFARTTPQTVANRIVHAIEAKRHSVATGLDGVGMVWLGHHLPRTMHQLMNFAYRRIAEPEQFAMLDALSRKRSRVE